ncbi:MAG: cysteine--tRNA ligase [Bacteroidetes bacterium HGW-Bacteroidetes-1]|jgi:cysteinyl-tRNA synthetase|nr:MAG: cysteine--tRNA ligase [Bacteroidetes bacterium HGW-Bacteroidetes-1]
MKEHNIKPVVYLFNSLSRKKGTFEPLQPPHVGMYVCGPTVYGDAHLGHARPAITFDLVYRYLTHLGYKVRYVRNITDVGHLENDADEGEDKIAQKARLEQIEPMEVVQHFTVLYHKNMDQLNVLRPSIEPHASGHVIEQITMVQKILEKGYAYEVNGSVYFDVEKYNRNHHYGVLSGRKIEDLISNTRTLSGQSEKRNNFDFALWKKAEVTHIMRWPSPWGDGFPGWHMECSAMGCKYLGTQFDIHGGGMDLLFPHHESEIAQSTIANGKPPAHYWMHNNMITINGQKMGKSLGNAMSLDDLFTGNHPLLEKAYSPMTIRFFILQAQYRSTLDFSNEALQAAEKGMKKLLVAAAALKHLTPDSSAPSHGVSSIVQSCYTAMNDDFNSPVALAALFDAVRIINAVKDGLSQINIEEHEVLLTLFDDFVFGIMGLLPEDTGREHEVVDGLMQTIIDLRQDARSRKDYATSDKIRDRLQSLHIEIKDGKEGTNWQLK